MKDKLVICKQTRKIAADALEKALRKILKSNKRISEVDFRDAWLSEMRKSKKIFPDGWYVPPPHGIIVLFAKDGDVSRTHYGSARPKEFWPKKDVYLNRENGIILLYASPVDKKTGIIGDFEMTIYFGKNKKTQHQIKKCLQIINNANKQIKINSKFKDIVGFINKSFRKAELFNDVYSISDKSSDNMGHTIPFSYEDATIDEMKKLKSKSWKTVCKAIAEKRIYVKSIENFQVKPALAFTIEPRARIKNDKNSPLVMFHSIIILDSKGRKEVLTGFDRIFKLTGMDYMLRS